MEESESETGQGERERDRKKEIIDSIFTVIGRKLEHKQDLRFRNYTHAGTPGEIHMAYLMTFQVCLMVQRRLLTVTFLAKSVPNYLVKACYSVLISKT